MRGPHRDKHSLDEEEPWEYAGDAQTEKWNSFKDHSNSKSGQNEFHYRDKTPDSISKSKEFEDIGYQENPEKM